MKITPEVEFNIIRNEDESRGFYVAVTDNYQLDALIQSMGHEDVPLFWETYDQEQGAALFAFIVASNIPYVRTGWQDL